MENHTIPSNVHHEMVTRANGAAGHARVYPRLAERRYYLSKLFEKMHPLASPDLLKSEKSGDPFSLPVSGERTIRSLH